MKPNRVRLFNLATIKPHAKPAMTMLLQRLYAASVSPMKSSRRSNANVLRSGTLKRMKKNAARNTRRCRTESAGRDSGSKEAFGSFTETQS